jgi:hypothetical protein
MQSQPSQHAAESMIELPLEFLAFRGGGAL